MKNKTFKPIIILFAFGLALIVVRVLYVGHQRTKHLARCTLNLREIATAQFLYSTDYGVFSNDFSGLLPYLAGGFTDPYKIDYRLIKCICPALKREPGVRANIDQWSSYVIIPGLSPFTSSDEKQSSQKILAYCPPDNHPPGRAIVVFTDCHMEFINEKDFEKLLKNQDNIQ